MDTSETYIKMCDCPLIQEMWKLKNGDWTVFPITGAISIKHIDEDDKYYSPKKTKTIKKYNTWLPLQGQIQEMFGYHKDSSLLLYNFFKFCFKDSITSLMEGGSPLVFQFPISTSREQLWLAFYMHEKHKKQWTGKEWK